MNKKEIKEAVSGEKVTKAAQTGSGKEAKAQLKDTTKKIDDFQKTDADQEIVAPKFTPTEEQQEYIEDIERGLGMQDLRYDNEPSDAYKERQKKAIEGDSTLGNKTTDDQENDEFGKKFAEITKRRAERMDAAEVATVGLGDDIETVPKAKNPKTKKIALESKRTTTKLTTKTEIGGLDRAISLIPENLKVDGKKVIMTDGNETYKFRWNGELNEAEVLFKENKKQIAESKSQLDRFFNHKVGDKTGASVMTEKFNVDMLAKTRKISKEITRKTINESVNDAIKNGELPKPKYGKNAKVNLVESEGTKIVTGVSAYKNEDIFTYVYKLDDGSKVFEIDIKGRV